MIIKGEFYQSLCLCLVKFACFLSSSFRLTIIFKKKSFGNTIRVSNSLDPDQAQHFITSTSNVTNPPGWNIIMLLTRNQLYKLFI